MKEKVSIVVPVYGVEKYIEDCLNSLIHQSYSNLEMVVIDDGSNDSSGIIADTFAAKDERIKVIHIDNRGAAGARNEGLDACTGDYIMFVDGDDWLELKAVEMLLTTIQSRGCDVVQCQFYDDYINESVPHIFMNRSGILTSCEFAEDMLTHWENILLWNKLFSARVLEGIKLEEGHCIDDEFFTYKVVINSERIHMIEDCLYHYRNRKSSAMNNTEKQRQRLMDQIDFVTKRYEPLCKAYPQLKEKILQHLLEVLMTVMRTGAEYQDIFITAQTELKKYGKTALLNLKIDRVIKKNVCKYLISSASMFRVDHDTEMDIEFFFE